MKKTIHTVLRYEGADDITEVVKDLMDSGLKGSDLDYIDETMHAANPVEAISSTAEVWLKAGALDGEKQIQKSPSLRISPETLKTVLDNTHPSVREKQIQLTDAIAVNMRDVISHRAHNLLIKHYEDITSSSDLGMLTGKDLREIRSIERMGEELFLQIMDACFHYGVKLQGYPRVRDGLLNGAIE